jgi:hypothetical protein
VTALFRILNAEAALTFEDIKDFILVSMKVQRRRVAGGRPVFCHARGVRARAGRDADANEGIQEPEVFAV